MTNVKFVEIENNFVINILIADISQKKELENALKHELVYEPTIDLQIGDKRTDNVWTRNVDGVQTELTEKPTYEEMEAELAAIDAAMARGVQSVAGE